MEQNIDMQSRYLKIGLIRTSMFLYLFGTPEEEELNRREEEAVAGELLGVSRGHSPASGAAACDRWSARPPSVLAAFWNAAAIAYVFY